MMREVPVDRHRRGSSGGVAKTLLLVVLTIAIVAGAVLMMPRVVSGTLVTHASLRFAPEAGKSSEPVDDPVLPTPNSQDAAGASPAPDSPGVFPSASASQNPSSPAPGSSSDGGFVRAS